MCTARANSTSLRLTACMRVALTFSHICSKLVKVMLMGKPQKRLFLSFYPMSLSCAERPDSLSRFIPSSALTLLFPLNVELVPPLRANWVCISQSTSTRRSSSTYIGAHLVVLRIVLMRSSANSLTRCF